MKNYLVSLEDFLEPIGYTTTTIGTLVGVIALVMTIKINNKTNKIQKNMELIKFKTSFNMVRLEIISKSKQVYGKYKKDGQLLIFEIKEITIDLNTYKSIYTDSMKKLLDDLDEASRSLEQKGRRIPKLEMEKIMMNIYNIQRKLESNLDVLLKNEGDNNE